MEDIPRPPMLGFDLLTSEKCLLEPTLKAHILNEFVEDPESYSNEIHELLMLREKALSPSVDITSCQLLKKYYCQMNFLKNRFCMEEGEAGAVKFSWKDENTKMTATVQDIYFELMCILINIGSMHATLGANDCKNSPNGYRMAFTHFRCAAWVFEEVEQYFNRFTPFITTHYQILAMQYICKAQAQECILEEVVKEKRRPHIPFVLSLQIIEYYSDALTGYYNDYDSEGESEEEIVIDDYTMYLIKYLEFKLFYHSSFSLFYHGKYAEILQQMGLRVAIYEHALDYLEEARKKVEKVLSSYQDPIKKTIAFAHEVIEENLRIARNENKSIYHQAVPHFRSIPDYEGKSFVKGIPFDVFNKEVSGPDLFERLNPLEYHAFGFNRCSDQKDEFLRVLGNNISIYDQELTEFMDSKQSEVLNLIENSENN